MGSGLIRCDLLQRAEGQCGAGPPSICLKCVWVWVWVWVGGFVCMCVCARAHARVRAFVLNRMRFDGASFPLLCFVPKFELHFSRSPHTPRPPVFCRRTAERKDDSCNRRACIFRWA